MSETVSFTTRNPGALFAPVLPVLKSQANRKSNVPALSFAQVLVTSDAVHVVATDRYTLVESRESVEGNQPGTMFLPLEVVAVLAKWRHAAIVTYTVEGGSATIAFDNQSWTFAVPDYPDMAPVAARAWAKRTPEYALPLTLSPTTFDTVTKVAKSDGRRANLTFYATPGSVGQPWGVQITDTIRMLVMPVRMDLPTELFHDWPALSETVEAARQPVESAA